MPSSQQLLDRCRLVGVQGGEALGLQEGAHRGGERVWQRHDSSSSKPISKTGVTSLMIRHIPCRLAEEEILEEINSAGFRELYDFFYVPREKRQVGNKAASQRMAASLPSLI